LNDPTYGWGYLPAVSTTISKIFKDEVDAAITALHLEDPRQSTVTKLHLYLFAQGENDAAAGESGTPVWSSESSRYGYLLADHLRALEDTARWNIADSDTVYLLFDIPERIRGIRGNATSYLGVSIDAFDGHAQAAALFGARAFVIPTTNIPTQSDAIHYTGEGADTLGIRAANLLLSNTGVDGNTGGAFRLTKNYAFPDPIYAFQTDSASAPASTQLRWNVGRTELKIHDTNSNPLLSDTEAMGLGLFQVGDVLRIEKQTNAAIYVDCTITGLPTDNTTWFSYPVTSVSVGTLVAADGVIIKPQNTAFHDGRSYSAATGHNLQSTKQNLTNEDTGYSSGAPVTTGAEIWRNHHILIVNEQGRQYRSPQLAVRSANLRTDDAVTTLLLSSRHFEDGRVEYVKATVCYKIPSNGNVGVFIIQGVVRRTGASTVVDWSSVTETVDEEGLATNPTITAESLFGLLEGWNINVTGKIARNIDWVCEVETILIPNQITST
jgi:hypothetical protein